MDGLIEAARREALSMEPECLVVLAWEIPGAPSLDSFAHRSDALVVWDTRASGHGEGEVVVGIGVGALVESSGADRWDDIERRATDVFVELRTFGAARPRFFGGLAFAVGGDELWSGFGDASFVMPRFTLVRSEGQTRIELVVRAQDLATSNELESEVREIVRFVREGASVSNPAPPSAPRIARESPDEFMRMVTRALGVIDDGALDKIVLSRTTQVVSSTALDRSRVLAGLAGEEGTTRFCMTRGGRSFVGATPERLVTSTDGRIETEAVAGSVARGLDVEKDHAALLSSEKDRREHEWVVRAIVEGLSKWATDVHASPTPGVRSLRHLHHLVTPISAKLADGAHVLRIVRALHPTPAVSGWPIASASRAIRSLEGRDRGWYASPIGWFDARGRGSFVVGIRSALLAEERATVFAGAGIVRGSDPRAEWDETCVKETSMLRALGAM